MAAIFWLLLTLAAASVCLSTFLGFLARLSWQFELFSHFRALYTLVLTGCTLAFEIGGRYLEAGLCAAFALANLALILPLYFNRPQVQVGVPSYRILLSNVLQPNHQYSKVLDLVRSFQPDFVALIETGEHWMAALEPLRVDYPYVSQEFWGEENYDISLFSRLPFESVEIRSFEANHVPSIVARFRLDGQPLTVIATHPAPPKSKVQARDRDEQLAAIAQFVRRQTGAVIVVGDLNTTSWTPAFGNFLRLSGLSDSRRGFGLQPTWRLLLPFPLIPIDHLLVSPEVIIHNRRVGPFVGSDHHPVLMDFSLKARRD